MPEATASFLQIYVFARRFATDLRLISARIRDLLERSVPGGADGGTPEAKKGWKCARWCRRRDTGNVKGVEMRQVVPTEGHRAQRED